MDLALADYPEAIRVDSTQLIFYIARAKVHRALGNEAQATDDEGNAKELHSNRQHEEGTLRIATPNHPLKLAGPQALLCICLSGCVGGPAA